MTLVLVPQIVKVPEGQPAGGLNCQCAAAATCVIHATGGTVKPSASQVRSGCKEPNGKPDKVGGTNLRQAADSIDALFNVEMEVVTPEQYTKFRSRMQKDKNLVASVSIGYSALIGTPVYASRTGFRGNHQFVVRWVGTKNAEWEKVDPLADGRGVPKDPGRISDTLLRKAAGALVVTTDTGISFPLGAGKVYVGYVRGKSAPVPAKQSVVFTPGNFYLYSVQGNVAINRVSKAFGKRTSARCDPLASIPYPSSDSARKKLVKVLAGSLKGQYVEPGRAHVELVTA